MQFAKLFAVARGNTQLLAVLDPGGDDDGLPRITMITEIDGERVSFCGGPLEPGDEDESLEVRRARVRERFDEFGPAQAEQAWELARVLAGARRAARDDRYLELATVRAPAAALAPALGPPPAWPLVPAPDNELGIESYPTQQLRSWLDAPADACTTH